MCGHQPCPDNLNRRHRMSRFTPLAHWRVHPHRLLAYVHARSLGLPNSPLALSFPPPTPLYFKAPPLAGTLPHLCCACSRQTPTNSKLSHCYHVVCAYGGILRPAARGTASGRHSRCPCVVPHLPHPSSLEVPGGPHRTHLPCLLHDALVYSAPSVTLSRKRVA